MAKITLSIPQKKMPAFIKELVRLGIPAPTIHRDHNYSRDKVAATLHKISVSFILVDWEFFSNELEYE